MTLAVSETIIGEVTGLSSEMEPSHERKSPNDQRVAFTAEEERGSQQKHIERQEACVPEPMRSAIWVIYDSAYIGFSMDLCEYTTQNKKKLSQESNSSAKGDPRTVQNARSEPATAQSEGPARRDEEGEGVQRRD